MVTMEKYLYVGGAISDSSYSKLCPIVSKFDTDLNLKWSYATIGCSESGTLSMSVDLMYADHLNNLVYGLMVRRDVSGTLELSDSYYLFFLKGNGDESDTSNSALYFDDCTIRRIETMKIRPHGSDATIPTYFWIPYGVTYSQYFNTASETSPFAYTRLIYYFRTVNSGSSSLLATNAL